MEAKFVISQAAMNSIAKFLPQDGFKLTPEMLDETYDVVRVIETPFQGTLTATVVLKNANRTINMSAGVLKKARVMGKSAVKVGKALDGNANIFLRPEANEIWDGSTYFHAETGMSQDAEFALPNKIKIRYAVVRENTSAPGTPVINPFLYEGFRKVVTAYAPEFPTFDDFKMELKKGGADRIAGLPVSTEPKTFDYVDEKAPSSMVFNLIFEDIKE